MLYNGFMAVHNYVFNTTAEARFWPKVTQQGDCWVWTAARSRGGYGMFTCSKRAGKCCKGYAHVVAYMWLRADVPDGLDLDHLCRNRACVNPWHLDPVPRRVNLLRGDRSHVGRNQRDKTHCPQGHPYSEANTYVYPDGRRKCRECGNATARERQRLNYIPHPGIHPNAAKTHCKRGHPFDEENTMHRSDGTRQCRICVRARVRARRMEAA
jgi:hypothetical protein